MRVPLTMTLSRGLASITLREAVALEHEVSITGTPIQGGFRHCGSCPVKAPADGVKGLCINGHQSPDMFRLVGDGEVPNGHPHPWMEPLLRYFSHLKNAHVPSPAPTWETRLLSGTVCVPLRPEVLPAAFWVLLAALLEASASFTQLWSQGSPVGLVPFGNWVENGPPR